MLSNKIKGYLFAVVAATTYGMNPLFALPLYADGMDADSVLFFRYLFALPVLAVMARSRGRSLKLAKSEFLPLLLMGLLFSTSSLTLFLSYNYMDAGIASTLLFVYPIMVALLMSLVFKEKLRPVTLLCLALSALGIGLLYKSGDGVRLSLAGTLLVMLSALSYALYMVAINKSPRLKAVPTLKLTFYVLLFGLSLFAVRLGIRGSVTLPHNPWRWVNLLMLALLPTMLSLICTTRAISYIGSTPTAILGALEPVTAIFFGITLFGETLTPREVMGITIIIASVTIVVAGGSLSATLTRVRKMFPRLKH